MFDKKDVFIANVLYKSAVNDEKQWRKKKENKHDIDIIDKLLKEIQQLGYPYKYFADITNRDNSEKELLNILLKYIGRFNDEGFSAELVGVVGKKGNNFATQTILKNYIDSSDDTKHKQAGFYDGALSRIKDKRYSSTYIELLKTPENAIKLPQTMIMLGKWNCEEAKPYFLRYLNSNLLYINEDISDLVFISTEALSYYDDKDKTILNALETNLNSNNKDLISATKKAIKRLKKNTENTE